MEQKFTDEQLVRAWLSAESRFGLALSLGVDQSCISRRVARLRRAGVNLPKLPSQQRRTVDVAALNLLIAKAK